MKTRLGNSFNFIFLILSKTKNSFDGLTLSSDYDQLVWKYDLLFKILTKYSWTLSTHVVSLHKFDGALSPGPHGIYLESPRWSRRVLTRINIVGIGERHPDLNIVLFLPAGKTTRFYLDNYLHLSNKQLSLSLFPELRPCVTRNTRWYNLH